jgi:hypothetical protein
MLSTQVFAVYDEPEDVDLGWYAVEDWEKAICQDFWGGPRIQESETGEPALFSIDIYTNDLILTISAERSDPIPVNATSFGYIYEVSWYVQPVQAAISYEISIQGLGINEVIDSGSATRSSGFSGHEARVYAEENALSTATLKVIEADATLVVPFVSSESSEEDLIEKYSWIGPFIG